MVEIEDAKAQTGINFKASSIVEVTIAMVIIVMVFTFTLMIYLNITKSTPNLYKVKIRSEVRDYAMQTIREKTFFNDIKESGNGRLEKKITPYNSTKELLLLNIRFVDASDSIWFERKQLVYAP